MPVNITLINQLKSVLRFSRLDERQQKSVRCGALITFVIMFVANYVLYWMYGHNDY